MRALAAGDVLSIVERGLGESPTSTALGILSRATDGESESTLSRLALGARDRMLLEVRQRSIGGPLNAVEICPHCDAELELALHAADLLVADPPATDGDFELQRGELTLRFRPPTSEDLLRVEACADEHEAVRLLAFSCIRHAVRAGRELEPAELAADLSDAEIDALSEAMAVADPQADLTLELQCAECAQRFERELDVAGFFAEELAGIARRLFAEIHVLARGYGWSESQILSLSAWRRRAYVEMLGS
jgi:hypothetical protein